MLTNKTKPTPGSARTRRRARAHRRDASGSGDGDSATLIVDGAPGFGKTRLLAEALTLASGFDVKSGFDAMPAADQAVPLGALIDALFAGSPPILERDALRGLHIVPAERYWLL
jgi:hypothetical protein